MLSYAQKNLIFPFFFFFLTEQETEAWVVRGHTASPRSRVELSVHLVCLQRCLPVTPGVTPVAEDITEEVF